jgi:hypothetical protein
MNTNKPKIFRTKSKAHNNHLETTGGYKIMMTLRQLKNLVMVLVMGLVFSLATATYADDQPGPIYLNPDGTLREDVAGGKIEPMPEYLPSPGIRSGLVTNVEGEAPQPDTRNRYFNIYVSAPGSGTIGVMNYADEDILRYDTKLKQWFKVFDGIDALANVPINLGQIYYMSFDTPVAVPGLGTVAVCK